MSASPRGFGWADLECRPRCWYLGVSWRWGDGHRLPPNRLDVWLFLVPCFPLHVVWHFPRARKGIR